MAVPRAKRSPLRKPSERSKKPANTAARALCRRSTRNCLPSWRAPRATLSCVHMARYDWRRSSKRDHRHAQDCPALCARTIADGVRCQRGPLPRHQLQRSRDADQGPRVFINPLSVSAAQSLCDFTTGQTGRHLALGIRGYSRRSRGSAARHSCRPVDFPDSLCPVGWPTLGSNFGRIGRLSRATFSALDTLGRALK
jgi:hypothetical protein